MLRVLCYRPPRPLITRHFYRSLSTAMAAQLPSHSNDVKKPKEKKDKLAAPVSQYPLEVSITYRMASL